jgi:glycosyltransferase involved in cell wall biosynthesis
MRVLHLDAGKEMRGGQWQVLRLIEGLAAEGVESTLLARAGAPLFEAARRGGWRVEPLSLARAAWLARGHDVVHAHDARAHTLAALLPAVRPVVSRRVAFPIGWRWKYGRARRYIAVSGFVRGVLMAGGVPENKISVVHDGVPLLEQAEGRHVLAPANQGDRQKGAPLALEAARLAGVELRLTAKLQEDLREAAVFLYLTRSEGLGSAVLLAMSAGVPVIASKVGGLPEIVGHRETGLLVENDARAVADALKELLTSRELANRLGRAARETVRQRFTGAHMVSRTMEVYRLAAT